MTGTPPRPPRPLPAELDGALNAEPDARARFDALSPAHRREYAEWVQGGRTGKARERRAGQAVMRLLTPPA